MIPRHGPALQNIELRRGRGPLSPEARIGLVPIDLRIRAWIMIARLRNGRLDRELEGTTCILDVIDIRNRHYPGRDLLVPWIPQNNTWRWWDPS